MTWGSRWVRRRACIRCSGRPGRIFGGSVGKSEHDTTRRYGAWRRQSRSDRASHGPRGSRRYSRKVPQQARTHGDLCTRLGTVTCADGLMWTGCRWMACKRSAVRARLAPLHGISAAQSLAELRGFARRTGRPTRRPGRTPLLLLQVTGLCRSDSEYLRVSQMPGASSGARVQRLPLPRGI
jgi:hypothetical protein